MRLLRTLVLALLASTAGLADAAEAGNGPVRIGLTPTFPSDQYQPLEQWRLYIERKLHRPVVFVRRDSYIETIDLLRMNKLDFAWICDFPYVYFRKQLKLLAVPVYKGRPYYQSYVIVPAADRTTMSVAQLEGKIFAYSDPYSNTGYLAPRFMLHQAGKDPAHFFRKTFFAWSHRRVLEAVATGLADGGAVSSHVWDTLSIGKPELTAATRIVQKSEDYGFAPFVARSSVDDAEFGAMQQVLLDMQADAEGRSLLKVLNLDGFTMGNANIFAHVERAMRAVGEK